MLESSKLVLITIGRNYVCPKINDSFMNEFSYVRFPASCERENEVAFFKTPSTRITGIEQTQ